MNDLANAFAGDDLTSKLLNALPCGVVIISEDGTVVKLNNAIEHIFRVKNAEVLGDEFGQALCCIHSCDKENICGLDNGCKNCEIRKLALMALYSNEKKRRRVSLQVEIDSCIRDVTFLICAAPLKFAHERLILLTIENISNLKPLVQICRGLQYAHERQIVHQDIKPGNIFILPNDKIRILDFGLAAPFGSEGYMSGSPFYMAPEQVDCLPVDNRTDIYSLGLTVYEMVTGKKPFYSADEWEMMQMRVTCDVRVPAAIQRDLPDALLRFISKACARNPADRYGAVEQILEDIGPLAQEYGVSNEILLKEKQNISTIFLLYGDGHLSALKHLMDEFSLKANKMGIKMKFADIQTG
jgi:hypothetical protein